MSYIISSFGFLVTSANNTFPYMNNIKEDNDMEEEIKKMKKDIKNLKNEVESLHEIISVMSQMLLYHSSMLEEDEEVEA